MRSKLIKSLLTSNIDGVTGTDEMLNLWRHYCYLFNFVHSKKSALLNYVDSTQGMIAASDDIWKPLHSVALLAVCEIYIVCFNL